MGTRMFFYIFLFFMNLSKSLYSEFNNRNNGSKMSEKSEKKGVSKVIVVLLGVICIVLAVTTVLFAFNYIPTVNSNRSPKLVNVGLGANDLSDEYPYESKIHIVGYIINTGLEPAYKTKLHVVAYLTTGAVAIDDYYEISGGMISGGEIAQIDITTSYQSFGITRTTMTPEWSAIP
jgi:FlaG/FlaF family flagellin (archaellin)